MNRRAFRLLAAACLALAPVAATAAASDRLLIRLAPSPDERLGIQRTAERLSVAAGVALTRVRPLSGGGEVWRLPRPMQDADLEQFAARLRELPQVAAVQPDYRLYPARVPSDPWYAVQWHLHAAEDEPAGADLPDAWEVTTGSPEVVVAVLDTGVLSHPDLDGRLIPHEGAAYPYGYDFVDFDVGEDGPVYATANDGDGRDPDPRDPGDWITPAEAEGTAEGGLFVDCPVTDSSWHGTHVMGTIGAAADNGIGIAGVDWNARLLPVRVLGKCGGYVSDIIDGMRWAAGLSVPDVPANPYPARVINLSLGGSEPCGQFTQDALDDVAAAGAVVVVAAGNEAVDISGLSFPGCRNTLSVTAMGRDGERADYANFGADVDIAGPGGESETVGGGVLSSVNGGETAPTEVWSYLPYAGTSMATPHVSGVLSLMLAANRAGGGDWLDKDVLTAKLLAAARPFPVDSQCAELGCGVGRLDAAAAVAAVSTAPTAVAAAPAQAPPGAEVSLDGRGSVDDGAIRSYRWTQVDGSGYTVALRNAAVASFTVPQAPDGTVLRFRLQVTDDVGLSASSEVEVVVDRSAEAPEPVDGGGGGGGGGGAAGPMLLFALGGIYLARRRRSARR